MTRFLVTGRGGFVGKHVVAELAARKIETVNDFTDRPDAVIHLAWGSLPNYTSGVHAAQENWHHEFLSAVIQDGIKNITAAGSCLETVDDPPAYALAKISVRDGLLWRLPGAKWVRLWQLYGDGQRAGCLLPSLRAAVERGDESFSVIGGARDFMDVRHAAKRLVDAAMQSKITGIMDCCTGIAEPVADFCRRQIGKAPIRIETGYAMPPYEPAIFRGNPEKMNGIPEYVAS